MEREELIDLALAAFALSFLCLAVAMAIVSIILFVNEFRWSLVIAAGGVASWLAMEIRHRKRKK